MAGGVAIHLSKLLGSHKNDGDVAISVVGLNKASYRPNICDSDRTRESNLELYLAQSSNRNDNRSKNWELLNISDSTDGQLRLGPMQIVSKTLKVLLVFSKEDSVSESWSVACKRQGHEVSLSRTAEDAKKAFCDHNHDLVIIDARSHKHFHAENISKSIRNSENSQFTVIVGVVKKSFADRENPTVVPMLKNGFNRVVTEISSVGGVLNDLIQIEHSEIVSMLQQRATLAVFAALDACKEVVHITDPNHKIQYVNRACENLLGYNTNDVVGKSVWELHGSDNHKLDNTRSIDHRPSVDQKSSIDHQRVSVDHQRVSIDHRTSISDHRTNAKLVIDISEAVNTQMRRGREWEGIVTCRRKSGDTVHLPSKVVPVAPQTKKTEFLVYSSDTHLADKLDFPPPLEIFHPRGSIKSLRKGSYDIRSLNSDGTQNVIRRQSLVKLHSVTIEAPITRVFNIITAAQENSPSYVAQALEKVLEILRSTELYSPQLISAENYKPGSADPVANDLLGALLSQGPKPLSSGRRSSNDQAMKVSNAPRPSLPSLPQQASTAIKELLADSLTWKFDVIKLEGLTENKPLVWLGMSLLCHFDVPNTLGCDEQTLQNWLNLIEANYHLENTYHNSTHAADVLQTTAYFLEQERIKCLMDPLDMAACLIAAVVHDVDHPGKNSQFLCNTDNELAILYNDISVLESHHAAVSFKYTTGDERVNIFKGLDRDTYKHVRKNIIDMVLATDMTKHFEHLSKFVNMATKQPMLKDEDNASLDGGRESPDFMAFGTPENVIIIKRMLIKCADISNPVRPLHLCIEWGHRIANEYFTQTEEEKKRSLPIVMPQFDRTSCSIPKSQIGFIDFFISDMFDNWDALADVPELMNHLRTNYQYWKEQEEDENQIASKTEIQENEINENSPMIEEKSQDASDKRTSEASSTDAHTC
ncbi:unnamed protein product, partial [Meganyctiphanes norvegica]